MKTVVRPQNNAATKLKILNIISLTGNDWVLEFATTNASEINKKDTIAEIIAYVG